MMHAIDACIIRRKIMKKIQCIVFLTVVLLLASVSSAQEEISAGDVLSQKEFIEVSSQHEIAKEKMAGGVSSLVLPTPNANVSNNYISIVVARGYYTGTYTMGTTGGDPMRTGDENKMLLYGHPSPWSSYLTVRIDGTNYVTQNGAMNQYWISGPNVIGNNSIVTKWQIQNIEITQTISIITSSSTGYADTGLFKITLKNNGTTPRSVGARFLLDTMLGNNDAAPFYVPGVGNVTSEREFSSSNMPPYWQVFDSLSNPTVIAQGTLSTSTPPDRFILANWGRLYSAPWNYTVLTGYPNGDSAAAVYWFPVTLAGGATVEYATAYGLGGVTMSPGVLSLGLSAPLNLTSSTGNFTVTAYVENTGQTTANGVNATISLPSGLSLASGETSVKSLGNLASGATGMASWIAQANGIPGTYNYSVTASSQNTNSTTAYRTITVPTSAMVKINNAAAAPNANTSTQIVLSAMSDFGTANIDLFYNPSVVQVTGASIGFSGYGGSLTPNIDNTIGKARFLITVTDIPGPNSPLTLVNVNLQAVGSIGQVSPLELSVITLAHSDGSSVIPSVQNGIFNISISSVIPGDVTGNGMVDAIDSMFLAQYVAGTRLTLPQQQAGDVASPCGSIDAIDSMFVAQYVAGTRTSLQLCS
jgi:hypothetical protein